MLDVVPPGVRAVQRAGQRTQAPLLLPHAQLPEAQLPPAQPPLPQGAPPDVADARRDGPERRHGAASGLCRPHGPQGGGQGGVRDAAGGVHARGRVAQGRRGQVRVLHASHHCRVPAYGHGLGPSLHGALRRRASPQERRRWPRHRPGARGQRAVRGGVGWRVPARGGGHGRGLPARPGGARRGARGGGGARRGRRQVANLELRPRGVRPASAVGVAAGRPGRAVGRRGGGGERGAGAAQRRRAQGWRGGACDGARQGGLQDDGDGVEAALLPRVAPVRLRLAAAGQVRLDDARLPPRPGHERDGADGRRRRQPARRGGGRGGGGKGGRQEEEAAGDSDAASSSQM
mmetsp:Transcript_23159/g.54934  ORF Transcript_23159/g.54934 Transcript_23159/m.54934 type:complete len:346 (-) Transcript_23159:192-1229(-)